MGRVPLLVVLALFLSSLQGMLGYDGIRPPTLPERDSFLKRLADTTDSYINRFTGHDVAHVMYEREPNSFQRVSKRDLKAVLRNKDESVQYNIRLEFSSGLRRMHLKLNKKQSLFDSNTRFIDNVRHGRVQRVGPPEDCYLTGNVEMEEGIPDGIASVAMCDGLHGHVSVNGSEYYIYPVEHDADEEHQAHVLSRRASEQATTGSASENSDEKEEESTANEEKDPSLHSEKVTNTTWKTADSFVVELALFVDAARWSILQKESPGREQEFVLITMAHVASYYSGKEKVGYWARFKIKLYETWIEDPPGYQSLSGLMKNLKNFCDYTRPRYKYDMHFLLTGKHGGGISGYAYTGQVCKYNRCGNAQHIGPMLVAHEIGHLLGFNHHGNGNCPDEVKALGGGFMYGSERFDFSPCNKVELQRFFSKGGGRCLFKETAPTLSDDEYANLLQVFPGQYHNPDQYCQSKLGKDFALYRPFDFRYRAECTFRMCMNMNESSPEYLMIQLRKYDLPYGAPCGRGMLCDDQTCLPWERLNHGFGPLPREQKMAAKNTWTPWPSNWSPCSHSCGKGVQHKRRTCILGDVPFLNPYCRGPSVQSRLCNLDPCPNEPVKKVSNFRYGLGRRVCQDMLDRKAILPDRSKYVNTSKSIFLWSPVKDYIEKKSCFLQCIRENSKNGFIDKFYPDGTPCLDSRVHQEDWKNYNITMRCVQGDCIEFNDCPNNQVKDVCGVCGGAYLRCIQVKFDAADDVPKGERKVLAELPAGTSRIVFKMKWYNNKGVVLELWDSREQKILGKGDGQFKVKYANFKGKDFIFFANTKWTYDFQGSIRAEGPIDQDLVVKAYRQDKPIKEIYARYLLSESAAAKQREKMEEYGRKVITKLKNLTKIFSKPHPRLLSDLRPRVVNDPKQRKNKQHGKKVSTNDCPNNQVKDVCGVCGGAYLRCILVKFDVSDDVPKGERKVLAELPAGTSRIVFNMTYSKNPGIILELWDSKEQKILGDGDAQFKVKYANFKGKDFVFFANTKWTYDHKGFIRAEGPIDQDLVVKAYRQDKPIKEIFARYLLSESAAAKQREKMKEYGRKVLTKLENLTNFFSKPHPKLLNSLPAVSKAAAREWCTRLCLLSLLTIFAV